MPEGVKVGTCARSSSLWVSHMELGISIRISFGEIYYWLFLGELNRWKKKRKEKPKRTTIDRVAVVHDTNNISLTRHEKKIEFAGKNLLETLSMLTSGS